MRKWYVLGGLGILLVLILIVYSLSLLPHWAVLAWAILATVLLPAVAFGGWMLGRYEAGAVLRGIDAGVDRVAGAAVKLRTREPRASTNIAVLPQMPPVIHRPQLTEGEVVDL